MSEENNEYPENVYEDIETGTLFDEDVDAEFAAIFENDKDEETSSKDEAPPREFVIIAGVLIITLLVGFALLAAAILGSEKNPNKGAVNAIPSKNIDAVLCHYKGEPLDAWRECNLTITGTGEK